MAFLPRLIALPIVLSPFALPGIAAAQTAREPIPPQYDDVMAAMCNARAKNQSCLLEGKRPTYWLSLTATIDGKKWYTALATARNEAAAGEDDMAAPGEKLSLAQVTYVLEAGRWKLLARQIDFGAVYASGAAGNPPMDDDNAPYFEKALPDGAIVGYPTTTLAMGGIALYGYTMFRTAHDKSGRWIYGGTIDTGQDNAADCDPDESPSRCYSVRGSLTEAGRVTVGGWPEFTVKLKGTLIGDSGEVRQAMRADASLWRFDVARSAYVDAKAR